jgi:hypothetical protein
MSFAEKTTVSPAKSKAEIEDLLRRYGADQFMNGWDSTSLREVVGFRCQSRFIRFELPMPDRKERRFTHVKRRAGYSETTRTEKQATEAWEQEVRRRWRALALVIKAKLEAVESGITSFEHEFMAHIVMPDGKTVGQHVGPAIAQAYQSGRVPLLLPEWTGE